MSAQDKPHTYQDRLEALPPELGYVWAEPSSPYPLPAQPFWMQPERDAEEALIEVLIEEAWKVAFIRQQIEALGMRPKGRTRAGLVRQLVEGFMDPKRLQQAFSQLSPEERQQYLCLLLQNQFQGLDIYIPDRGSVCEMELPYGALMHRILMMGLGLQTPDGEFFLPFQILKHLPPTSLDFPEADKPESYCKAASSHRLMLRIQQLVTLIQSREGRLRPLPRWEIPNLPYGRPRTAWPPVPDDAKSLTGSAGGKMIQLLALPPFLAEETLAEWRQALDLSTPEVEFIYHLLTAAGLLHAGSPIQPEPELIEAWLAIAPSRQLSILYKIFQSLGQWAAWTPLWRENKLRVQWQAYQLWNLTRVDQELYTARYRFRWALLDVLSFLPHDTWLDVDAIGDWLIEMFPTSDMHHYLYDIDIDAAPGGWKMFLRMGLESLLTGPLYNFGLVDLAPSRDAVSRIRLHQLQDLHWQRTENVSLASVQALNPAGIHLSVDKQILGVETPAPPDFLAFVQSWAEPAGLNADELRYQLDVARLHRAFEQGQMPDVLARRWEEHVGFAPPKDLRAWWQRWWERYGHVRLYKDQAVLMTQDDFTMQELKMALPKLESAIQGWATSRAALLNPDRVDEILADMERQGYMPKEASPDGRS
jgi:hypothetical protein